MNDKMKKEYSGLTEMKMGEMWLIVSILKISLIFFQQHILLIIFRVKYDLEHVSVRFIWTPVKFNYLVSMCVKQGPTGTLTVICSCGTCSNPNHLQMRLLNNSPNL